MPARIWLNDGHSGDDDDDDGEDDIATAKMTHGRLHSRSKGVKSMPNQGRLVPTALTTKVDPLPRCFTASRADPKTRSYMTSSEHHSKKAPKPRQRLHPDPTCAQFPGIIGNLIDSFATIQTLASPRLSQDENMVPELHLANSRVHSLDIDIRAFDSDYDSIRDGLRDQHSNAADAAESPVIRTVKPSSSWYQSTAESDKCKSETNGVGVLNNVTYSGSSLHKLSRSGSSNSLQDFPTSNRTWHKERARYPVMCANPEGFDGTMSSNTKNSLSRLKPPTKAKHLRAFSPAPDLKNQSWLTGVESERMEPTSPVDPAAALLHKRPALDYFRSLTQSSPCTVPKQEERRSAKHLTSSPDLGRLLVIPQRKTSIRCSDTSAREANSLDIYTLPALSKAPPRLVRSTISSEQGDLKSILNLDIPDIPDTLESLNPLEESQVTKRIKELKAKKQQRELEARQSPIPVTCSAKTADPTIIPNLSASSSQKFGLTLEKISLEKHDKPSQVDYSSWFLEDSERPLTPTIVLANHVFVTRASCEMRPHTSAGLTSAAVSLNGFQIPVPSHAGVTEPAKTALTCRPSVLSSTTNQSFTLQGPVNHALRPQTTRQQSVDLALIRPHIRASSSASLTSRTKRWSHSDLSGALERRPSAKSTGVLSKRNPFQKDTAYEELTSPSDRIDRAVHFFIHAQRLSQKIRHPQTGRVISFSEVGHPKGNVVFCCVGMGLTRYITAFYDELATTLGLRIIAPDRPGVGDSQVDPDGTPLSWPDDLILICDALNITKFSILAHSAGAIYALAIALRVPQHIRGKVHLLAPWIPPSQMQSIGTYHDIQPAAQLPKSQRLLRALPAPFLKVANSSFLSATSASISTNLNHPGRRKRRSGQSRGDSPASQSEKANLVADALHQSIVPDNSDRITYQANLHCESIMFMDQQTMPRTAHAFSSDSSFFSGSPSLSPLNKMHVTHKSTDADANDSSIRNSNESFMELITKDMDFCRLYDERLTRAIWSAATTSANPAVDLLVCLERIQPVGFRYVDITRSVVIHHGVKDSRVPIDNVTWLANRMRRCEVRVLQDESHGLMASAHVMGAVLTEMAKEWSDWNKVISRGRSHG